jgi:hypothetical protein
MILFPGNDVLNNESSSISAILPTGGNSYSNTSSAESTASNTSGLSVALQTNGHSSDGTLTSTAIDVPKTNELNTSWKSKKLHMEGKYLKVPSEVISRLSQESQNGTIHVNVNSTKCVKTTRPFVLEPGNNFKENTLQAEENKNDGKRILLTAPLNTKRQKCMDKITTSVQTLQTSSICETPKHSSFHSPTILKSNSQKESEHATPTESVRSADADPANCLTCNITFSKMHLHSLQNTRNMKHVCEKCPETINSIKKLEMHMNEEQPFKCSHCNRKFIHIWQRVRNEILHSDVNRFTCEQCRKKFTSARYLGSHTNCHERKHICGVCSKVFSFISYLEKHRSRLHPHGHPSSNVEISEVVSLQQEAYSNLQNSLEEDVERHVDQCGQDEFSISCSSSNDGTHHGKLENSKSKTTAAGTAEIISGGSVSRINLSTDRGSGTTVKVYRNRRTASNKQCICNIGARACRSEVSEELGTFGSDDLDISYSKSSSKLHSTLKETTKQLSAYNENTGDGKLHVNINALMEEVSNNEESLDKTQVNATNRNLSACKECNFQSENMDDLMSHEQTVCSKVKVYSCFGCLKMFPYPFYSNHHKKCCVGNQ